MNLDLTTQDIWVIAICALSSLTCILPGVFLILSRSSMLADAISHAVLPGIAVAFVISGNRNPTLMFLGALISGILAALLSYLIAQVRFIREDASLGVVFTSFFAFGVFLISSAARYADIDPGCVLYGTPEFTPFNTRSLLGLAVPQTLINLLVVYLSTLAIFALVYKELVVSIFDKQFAASCGITPHIMRAGLAITVAAACVVTFDAIGAILVVALLIIPAATAMLLSNRIRYIVLIASTLGVISSFIGYLGALRYNTTVSGMVGTAAFAIFAFAICFSPSNSICSSILQRTLLKLTIRKDDALGLLYRWHELANSSTPTLTRSNLLVALGDDLTTRFVLFRLSRGGLISKAADSAIRLTEAGLVEGTAIIRSHRLWEGYLMKHLGLPLENLHTPSERTEHYIGRALAREIEKELGTSNDPHGRRIPKGY